MENDVKNRAIFLMGKLRISVNSLSKKYGLTTSTVNDQINGNSKIGVTTLCALLDYRPDISAEWLLRGEGDMLRGSTTNHTAIIPASNDERTMNERLSKGEVAEMKDTIRRQKREIDGLYERIAELKKGSITAATSTAHTA